MEMRFRHKNVAIWLATAMVFIASLIVIYVSAWQETDSSTPWMRLSFNSRSSSLSALKSELKDVQERPISTLLAPPIASLLNSRSQELTKQVFAPNSHVQESIQRADFAFTPNSHFQESIQRTDLAFAPNSHFQESIQRADLAFSPSSRLQDSVQQKDLASAPALAPELSSEASVELNIALPQSTVEDVNLTLVHEDVLQASKSSQEVGKKPDWRLKTEEKLRWAKRIIESGSSSPAPQLYHPAFKNASVFIKSCEIMEQMFRIFIYQEGEKPLLHEGPLTGIYSTEGRFMQQLYSSMFVTKNPQEASMFFLPYSVVHMVNLLYVPGSHSMLPLATFIKNYVNLMAMKYPFWNLTKGSDHFYLSCHDWGPATARDHPELRKNAVKVVCNADLTEEFVLGKDVSVPEIYLHELKLPKRLGGPGGRKRPYLAFFAGQMHGRVRPVLIKYWKDKDPDMQIYEVLPEKGRRKNEAYVNHMKSSKFCICAMGYEVNSPRLVESIYYECVPVIIADHFVLPFSNVLNWDMFSITVEEKDIPNLKEILMGVSERRYLSMQSRLRRIRQHFVWNPTPARYDMFYMILHSVWMSRLGQLSY